MSSWGLKPQEKGRCLPPPAGTATTFSPVATSLRHFLQRYSVSCAAPDHVRSVRSREDREGWQALGRVEVTEGGGNQAIYSYT